MSNTPSVSSTPTLPAGVARRGIDEAQWNTLCNSLFPGAKPDSVLMAIDYCRSRQLDVMKKPCHIVPIQVKQGENYVWRDVVMPGIYEHRTTAMRTGLYLGHSKPEYGEESHFENYNVWAPLWCEMVVYRWNQIANEKIEFPIRLYFTEVVGLNKHGKANDRWRRAPHQMLTKCTEAAGLRQAFPDECGGQQTDDEMHGQIIDVTPPELQPERVTHKPETQTPQAQQPSATGNANGPSANGSGTAGSGLATDKQVRLLRAKLDTAGLSAEDLCKRYQIDSMTKLPFDSVNDALAWIRDPQPPQVPSAGEREPGQDG